MTNRREFLQTGVSVSTLSFAINGLVSDAAHARSADNKVALHKAIFDDRYAEGRAFAQTISGLGVPAEALRDGDVTHFYEELDLLWRERPAAIAGLTQFGPMFVLERLGLERGLRVARRVEHEVRSSGPLEHTMTGAPESVIHYYRPLALQEGRGIPWDGPLFSWVIAPAPPRGRRA